MRVADRVDAGDPVVLDEEADQRVELAGRVARSPARCPRRQPGVASGGKPQAAENSCEWIPSAILARAEEFINAILAVSSTSAAAPRSTRSAADISSVTVGGVWLIASAYSITLRSNGVNAPDFRHRGTSRALASSRPRLCAMK